MHSISGTNRTVIIINPKAGPRRLDFVTSNLKRFRNEFDYVRISSIDEFRQFVRNNLDKYDIFIAAGGDGTVNSLAAELAGTDKILGVLPAGSGNGFAREMGFRKNLRWLLRTVRRKEYSNVDVLMLNNKTCINLAGTGLDSIVAHGFHHLPRRGFWNYIIMAIRSVISIKPFTVNVTINGQTINTMVYMVSIANTRQFGNNALIVPHARPDDGKFDIAIVKPFPWYLFPVFAVKMQRGKLRESRFLTYLASENPAVINSEEKRYHIDGEPVIMGGEITITINKGALRVLRTSATEKKL